MGPRLLIGSSNPDSEVTSSERIRWREEGVAGSETQNVECGTQNEGLGSFDCRLNRVSKGARASHVPRTKLDCGWRSGGGTFQDSVRLRPEKGPEECTAIGHLDGYRGVPAPPGRRARDWRIP